mmetsp:Transcript_30782/g.85908  ORF Transcript_30782/g.85908 Transcript_30782/m.85908 type:complete len:114 (-) Transcript_30782:107-448(-)
MPSKLRCSHLLIKTCNSRNPVSRRTNQSTADVTEEAALKELEVIRQSLNADNFAEFASKRSDCGSFKNGGDLGEFGPGEMMQEFWDGTAALQVGQISGPVKTDSGIHLILRTM